MEKDSKHLTYITLFFLSVLILFGSFDDKYPEPVYYEVNFYDGNTHLWSRQIYYDYYGDIEQTNKDVEEKYKGIDDIDFLWSKKNYLDSRKPNKKQLGIKMNEIQWHCHENYKPTLDSYSQINVK